MGPETDTAVWRLLFVKRLGVGDSAAPAETLWITNREPESGFASKTIPTDRLGGYSVWRSIVTVTQNIGIIVSAPRLPPGAMATGGQIQRDVVGSRTESGHPRSGPM